MNKTSGSFKEAEKAVMAFAGGLQIFWGTGYAVRTPHVVASTLDGLSGEGAGYYARKYPQGDAGYGSNSPCESRYFYVGKEAL